MTYREAERLVVLCNRSMKSLRSNTPILCETQEETIRESYLQGWTRGDIIASMMLEEYPPEEGSWDDA